MKMMMMALMTGKELADKDKRPVTTKVSLKMRVKITKMMTMDQMVE